MGRITLLNQALTNMIAAGEVIERPSSVIKELVENSLDAGARTISVAIENAGRTRIVVSDDGSGMDRDDAILSLKRHATSKIHDEFDLFHIKTLGFRGEALPSIASVSVLDMVTSSGSGIGTHIVTHQEETTIEDAPLKRGTTVTVGELFYNTPARLKYLKSDQIENANNIEVISRIAVGHPDVAFAFSIDGREQFHTSGRNDQKEAIFHVFGAHAAKNLVSIYYEGPDYKVTGFLGKPDIAKSNRYHMITLLNGRSVYMSKIQSALIEGYRDFLPPSRFPFAIINLLIEPALLDVNVHPSKREVRFSKEEQLKETLLKLIPSALKETSLTAKPLEGLKETYPSSFDEQALASLLEPNETYGGQPQKGAPLLTSVHDFSVIGQLADTYIIATTPKRSLVLIDQHAAAERINYEKYRALADKGQYVSEPLVPLLIDLKPSDASLINDEKLSLLDKIGLHLEPFGRLQLRVIHLPIWAKESDEKAYVESLLDQVLHEASTDIAKLRDEAIASKSCKRSLKANQALSMMEMARLIDDLMNCENPYSCPHGRPTIIEFSQYDIEKMFKRTGF